MIRLAILSMFLAAFSDARDAKKNYLKKGATVADRMAAVRSLAESAEIKSLRRIAAWDPDFPVRKEALNGLRGRLDERGTAELLLRIVFAPPETRGTPADALADRRPAGGDLPSLRTLIADMIRHPTAGPVRKAMKGVLKGKVPSGLAKPRRGMLILWRCVAASMVEDEKSLAEELGDREPRVRAAVCRALGRAGTSRSLPALLKLIRNRREPEDVRHEARRAVERIEKRKGAGAGREVLFLFDAGGHQSKNLEAIRRLLRKKLKDFDNRSEVVRVAVVPYRASNPDLWLRPLGLTTGPQVPEVKALGRKADGQTYEAALSMAFRMNWTPGSRKEVHFFFDRMIAKDRLLRQMASDLGREMKLHFYNLSPDERTKKMGEALAGESGGSSEYMASAQPDAGVILPGDAALLTRRRIKLKVSGHPGKELSGIPGVSDVKVKGGVATFLYTGPWAHLWKVEIDKGELLDPVRFRVIAVSGMTEAGALLLESSKEIQRVVSHPEIPGSSFDIYADPGTSFEEVKREAAKKGVGILPR